MLLSGYYPSLATKVFKGLQFVFNKQITHYLFRLIKLGPTVLQKSIILSSRIELFIFRKPAKSITLRGPNPGSKARSSFEAVAMLARDYT